MAYKFEIEEPVRDAVSRCGREQLDRAIDELSEAIKQDPVSAVHNARKAIKMERSLLRLVRDAMPRGQRKRENAVLRDASRRLSGKRDAAVMVATLDDLSERFVGQLPANTFGAIREQLELLHSPNGGQGSYVAPALHELGAVRSRIDDWELTKGGWKAIEAGLLSSYARGRKALKRARRTGSLEDLHAWRKRAKDLWYHDRLLAPTCGPAVRGHAKDAHRLADLLGDDHDLGLLRHTLARGAIPAAVDVDAVVALIDHRRAELQAEAIRLGGRVYAESPKAFRRRVRRHWRAGRAVAQVPLERAPAELAAATR